MAEPRNLPQDSDELRKEIERTRGRMSHTIDALQTKLDPQRLRRQAADTIREGTVGRVEELANNASRTVKGAGDDVFETIRRNPIPAALAAIGLGWLWMERRSAPDRNFRPERYRYGRSDQYGSRYADDYGYDYAYGRQQGQNRVRQAAGGVQDRVRQATGAVSDTAGQVAGAVSDTAGQVAGAVSDTASQVAGTVSDTAGQVADNVQGLAQEAQWRAQAAGSRFQEIYEDNPLLVGAAAFAVGTAIGMSLPVSEKENQMMGEMRDQVVDKAQDTARDTMDKVQQVAQKAGEAARDAAQTEAQNQNLTSK